MPTRTEKNNKPPLPPENALSAGDDTSLSLIERIRRSPSVENWTAELSGILGMLRAGDIARLGEPSRYIRIIISGADSPALAEQAFRAAFDNILRTWQPPVPEGPDRLYHILRLIAGFTPDLGFIKLAGHLKKDKRFMGKYLSPFGREVDFQDVALSALNAYYPAPPPFSSQDTAYLTYVDILKSNLKRRGQFGSCAARLIDLKEFTYDSVEVLNGITHFREGLDEIIHLIFNPFRLEEAQKNLGFLYSHCKTNGLGEYFGKCTKPYGKVIEQPLKEVLHNEGRRSDRHRYPGLDFVRRDGSVFSINLEYDDTKKVHLQMGPDLEKLEGLIEAYRSSGGTIKNNLLHEIREELTAIIDKDVLSPEPQLQVIENTLKDLGGHIFSDGKGLYFKLDDSDIPLAVKSQDKLWAARQNIQELPTKNDFEELLFRKFGTSPSTTRGQ